CVGWCSKSSRTSCTLRFLRSIRLAVEPLTTTERAVHADECLFTLALLNGACFSDTGIYE
ncbi:MAG: hypothetical protein WCE98_04875, partial [Chlorobium sp.]